MAYEKQWSFNFDNEYTPSSALDLTSYELWITKALIKGELGSWSPTTPTTGFWTCAGSSDSATYGMDGVDRWLATYDGTKIVRGTGGGDRSWWVGQSPATLNGNTFYMCLSFDGYADTSASVIFAKTAFTGGSLTARPTSVDEWIAGGTGTTWNGGDSSLHRFHMGMTSEGSWYLIGCLVGVGYHELALMCLAPVSCDVTDMFPIFTYKFYIDGMKTQRGIQGSRLVGITNCTATRLSTGAAAFNTLPFADSILFSDSIDILRGAVVDLPCWIVTLVSGSSWHTRGRLPDMAYVPSYYGAAVIDDGHVVRDGTTMTAFTCGNMYLPGNTLPNLA